MQPPPRRNLAKSPKCVTPTRLAGCSNLLSFHHLRDLLCVGVTSTHAELARLYEHAENVLGGKYLPEAVLTQTLSGRWVPALTYIAPQLSGEQTTIDYVDRIVKAAKQHKFPEWYVERLNSFRP